MKKVIKQKWVAALRSGKYKQTEGALCRGNQNGKMHCCLGVLSELAVKEGVCSRRRAFEGNGFLNEPVEEWSGLQDSDPVVKINKNIKKKYSLSFPTYCLSSLNDNGVSFDEIANCIQRSL